MLRLPEVTLVCIETREKALMKLAIEDCLRKAKFADVLILTDQPDYFTSGDVMAGQRVRLHEVPDWPEKEGWCRAAWFDVPPLLRTSHGLYVQWDAGIVDPSMWDKEFLQYDYIGAPWWYKDGKNVGNSGFALISTALKRYIYDRRGEYPCDTSMEDDLLCRTYRPRLEEAGFKWAPEWVAHNFAFECSRPSPHSKHFGYHAAFNMGHVFDHDALLERAKLMFMSPYIANSYIGQTFAKNNPALMQELLASEVPNTNTF